MGSDLREKRIIICFRIRPECGEMTSPPPALQDGRKSRRSAKVSFLVPEMSLSRVFSRYRVAVYGSSSLLLLSCWDVRGRPAVLS